MTLRAPGPADVTIVVTTHNDAHFLADAMDSIAAQTHSAAEVIVVDDGSDSDPGQVPGFGPTVRLIRTGHQGLAAARNAGLEAATCPFILFLDADDVLTAEAVERGLACMAANPGAGLVYGAYSIVDHQLQRKAGPFVTRCGPLAHQALLRENVIRMHGTVLYDRHKLAEIGGFDADLARCEDYDVYLRMSKSSRIASHGGEVAGYRLHGQNMSHDTMTMLHWSKLVLDRHRPEAEDGAALAAWEAGMKALPRAFADQAWKRRGSGLRQQLPELRNWMRIAPASSFMAALRQALVAALPGPALDFFREIRRRMTVRKIGLVDFGDLARLRPVDPYFGFGRGTPVDRYYIEGFLSRHAAMITGHVLEFGDSAYSRRFGVGITRQDVFNSESGSPGATIIGDLAQADCLPADSFDCIVMTQTLQHIYDIKAAIASLHRSLRPGGALLATVPGLSPIVPDQWDWYWLFTRQSAMRLFADAFGAENVEIEVAGNLFSATCFLQGVATQDVGEAWLEPADPAYPVTIAITARKPGRDSISAEL